MAAILMPWLKFALCAALIGAAGPYLIRYGDAIATRTGLSRSWVGVALIATATSLPELVTGLSAVTVADAPNIAVGDVLGSCVFNLVILAVLDFIHREESIYRRSDQVHILTAGFGILLVGLAGVSLLLAHNGLNFRIFHIGLYSPIFIALYFVAMRAILAYETRRATAQAFEDHDPAVTLAMAIRRYLAAAAAIVVAGSWLPFVGVELADAMGWRTTFVGTLFIAGATSLPELAVTVSAVRIGALDIAIGNLLGSNMFNIFVLGIDDIAYRKGPLLAAVAPAHAVTAVTAMAMSGLVIVALLYRPASRLAGTVGWVSLALLALYLLSVYAIYLHGH